MIVMLHSELVDGRMRGRPLPNQGQPRQPSRCGLQAPRRFAASRQGLRLRLHKALRLHHLVGHLQSCQLTSPQVNEIGRKRNLCTGEPTAETHFIPNP